MLANGAGQPDTVFITGKTYNSWAAGNTFYVDALYPGYGHGGSVASLALYDIGSVTITTQGLFHPVSGGVGLAVRATDANNRYSFVIYANGNWNIYKKVAGTTTAVTSGSTSGTFTYNAAGNTLKVVAYANTMEFWIDGVQKTTITDTFNNTETHCGIAWVNESTGSTTSSGTMAWVQSWKVWTN